ncbi:hypothetical protein BDP27DRAFT_1420625 [Rhodocollybia butyracea]|uniref:Uncharacterized protein n=1 Tax=Rhodocollybia butyracea TaxID=206335 RepID=A0A9P5PPG6_9AGAR|nr:hypothetical protein BDP27DRAFT_1420625 [Rhodocollybia butyracea]
MSVELTAAHPPTYNLVQPIPLATLLASRQYVPLMLFNGGTDPDVTILSASYLLSLDV